MRSIGFRIFVAALLAVPLAAAAQQIQLDPNWDNELCAATGLCSNSPATGMASMLDLIGNIAIPVIRTVFIGVAVFYFTWYAVTMIIQGHDESALTENKKAFGHAAIGMALIGTASLIVDTFSPITAGPDLVAPTPFNTGVERIVDFITFATGVFLVFTISLAGFRIIALQGDESEIEKQKKSFFNGLLGVAILLLARVGVEAIIPSTGSASDLIPEVAGVIKFLLEIFAGLAVISVVVGGMFYIFSLQNEERAQRGRRIVLTTIIMLFIVIAAHTIVSTFIA